MTQVIKYPAVNPIRMFEHGVSDFWKNMKSEYEQGNNYCQKYLDTDTIKIGILCLINEYVGTPITFTGKIYENVIDLETNEYTEVGTFTTEIIQGPTFNNFYWCRADVDLTGLAGKTIFLSLNIVYAGSPPLYEAELVSELIRVETSFDDMLELTYTHDVNDFDFVFLPDDEDAVVITFRVEGGIPSQNVLPGGKYKIYNDQEYCPVTLQSQPFNTYKFVFGSPTGMPNWMIDKLNRIFALSTVTINGVQYNRIDGAKWDRQGVDGYALAGWSIELQRSQSEVSEVIEYDTRV